ncbi:MAG: radical SAM protein [Planctomycetota bacterium]
MRQGIMRFSAQGIHKYIAYFQAFCGTDALPEVLKMHYVEAVRFPGVVGLSVGTRPDMISDEKLHVLAGLAKSKPPQNSMPEKGLPDRSLPDRSLPDRSLPDRSLEVWIELGLQSAHDETLFRIRRGHDVACFDDAVIRADRSGLSTAAHVILGLPGENRNQMMATAEHLNALPVRGVKLHHLFVEERTELARLYANRAFRTLEMDEYLDLAIEFLQRLRKDIIIMRLMGKARSGSLIAPLWKIRTGEWTQRIQNEMVIRGCRQGDLVRE